jgi:hypothetical protein
MYAGGIGLCSTYRDLPDFELVAQIHQASHQVGELIPPALQDELINYFFEGPAQMFPIIFRDQFIQHRNEYRKYSTHLPFAFSPSLECIILAIAFDSSNDERAENLAATAKHVVDLERRAEWLTLGSVQACILIGWRDAREAGYYSAVASALAGDYFSLKFDDPSDCTMDSEMSYEEINTRRAVCWGLLVLDR